MRRYKHKLNMLEPGCKMLEVIGLLGIFSLIFYVLDLNIIYYICLSLAVAISIILIILLVIEHHQDEIQYRNALIERSEGKDEKN